MNITKEVVLNALRGVNDPELNKSLVDLGMVRNIEISGQAVRVTVALTMAGCPLKDQIKSDVRTAIEAIEDVGEVKVVLEVMTSEERAKLFGRQPSDMSGIKNIRHIIAVASGKGGVGKTTVTTNLAVALAKKGFKVGILDADMHGPDIPIMLGITDRPVGTGGMLLPLEKYGVKMMSAGSLAGKGVPIVWRGPLVNKAIKEFLGNVMWGDLDYLVVDLPPGTGDAALTVANSIPLDGVIIVTTPQKVAVEDVRRSIGLFRTQDIRVIGIVENMSFLRIPGSTTGETLDVFGSGGGEKVARAFNIPLLGKIPLDPEIRQGGDVGTPIALDAGKEASAIFERLAQMTVECLAS
jgi:ATP-binding protein involved in chromosome partitioning